MNKARRGFSFLSSKIKCMCITDFKSLVLKFLSIRFVDFFLFLKLRRSAK